MLKSFEKFMENLMFASRWLLAPFCCILSKTSVLPDAKGHAILASSCVLEVHETLAATKLEPCTSLDRRTKLRRSKLKTEAANSSATCCVSLLVHVATTHWYRAVSSCWNPWPWIAANVRQSQIHSNLHQAH